jgi:hypothetical protein
MITYKAEHFCGLIAIADAGKVESLATNDVLKAERSSYLNVVLAAALGYRELVATEGRQFVLKLEVS